MHHVLLKLQIMRQKERQEKLTKSKESEINITKALNERQSSDLNP